MINQNCPLLLRDLYHYDIVSAHPSILQKQFFDFCGVDLEDKKARNIFIGQSQIGNENLSSFLQTSVDNLVRFYLQENQVSEEEVITIQKDGVIIKKMLENDDEFIPIKYRGFIDFLILSPDRTKFLYLMDDKIIVKGISHYYQELDTIYQKFANFNFYDKTILFDQLQNIKEEILTTENKKLFLIPREENSFVVSTHKGDIQIKDPDFVDLNSIDRMKYCNHYFMDFFRSVYFNCY
jgi:hypothetical protein